MVSVNAWVKGLGSVLLALVLANPVCFCRAELAPEALAEVPETGRCCGEKPEHSAPEPGSPFLPCDCAMTVELGPVLALEALDKPIWVALRVGQWREPPVATDFPGAARAPRVVDIHGPPLRLLHSVFLL